MKRDFKAEKRLNLGIVIIFCIFGGLTMMVSNIGAQNPSVFGAVVGLIIIVGAIIFHIVTVIDIDNFAKWEGEKHKYIMSNINNDLKYYVFDFSTFKKINALIVYENGSFDIFDTEINHFHITDILKFNVVTDQNEMLNNSAVDGAAGAAVGGFLFGAVGAISGGILGAGKKPIKKLILKFVFKDFKDSKEILLFNYTDFSQGLELTKERENRVKLLSDLLDKFEIIEKKSKNKNKENQMGLTKLKDVDLITKFVKSNDLESKLEIMKRGITEAMIQEVKKQLNL